MTSALIEPPLRSLWRIFCSSSGGDFILDDPAVEQVDGAVGVLRKARVVRDHANGRASSVQFLKQIHDGFAIA